MKVSVIAHSVSPNKVQIASLQLQYPKFIHAEFMTHRVFSRNASSSRAIPISKMIAATIADTAMPIHWGANQKGMQAEKENDSLIEHPFNHGVFLTPQEAWLASRDSQIAWAKAFDAAGYHKQIVNRLIEPFININVIVTSTSWANFFALRLDKAAQPEIRALAELMFSALKKSKPKHLDYGEWHLPFVTDDDRIKYYRNFEVLQRMSVARCARVSYVTHDMRVPNYDEDIELYNRLVINDPIHASPAEHQATPDETRDHLWGNFYGWAQYRKMLPNEYISSYEGFNG